MEDNNSPRKTRSGKILGEVTMGRVEDRIEAEKAIREEAVQDVIDLTEDYFYVEDNDDALGDPGSNGDLENGTIIIEDDDDESIDDMDVDSNESDHLYHTLNESPIPTSSQTIFNFPGHSHFMSFSNSAAPFNAPGASCSSTASSSTSGDLCSSTASSSTSGDSCSSTTSASTSGASCSSTASSSTSGAPSSTAPSNASPYATCRICLDSQPELEEEGEHLLSTVCGHIFCSKCLPNVIKNMSKCPICRRVLTPKDAHPIFL